ncbi:MAG: hypothetical protein OEM20_01855 [Gammaproteobacteria bacterium]|nr:hypothetical protein [Gammaproteobacteria bacterium]
MRKLIVLSLSLLSAIVVAMDVPVDDLEPWTVLSFRNIQPNEVSVVDGALHIKVRGSASPLIYKFDEPTRIAGVTVVASWNGELHIPAGAIQGDENADDFVLKFGIVEAGDRRLNWFQRRIAADWIKQLFKLAPKNSGVNRINFLSTTKQQELLGTSRTHPLSELLYETRVLYLDTPGRFVMTHEFSEPVESLGLWVSVDGDNTGSNFDLRLERITLRTD